MTPVSIVPEIAGLPRKTAHERWGIGYDALGDRIKALGIVMERTHRGSILTMEQITQLDFLDRLLKKKPMELAALLISTTQQNSTPLELPPTERLVEEVLGLIRSLPFSPAPDVLSSHRQLAEAAAGAFVLSTKDLSQILGLTPKALCAKGEHTFGKYKISRAKVKVGRQNGWFVVPSLTEV